MRERFQPLKKNCNKSFKMMVNVLFELKEIVLKWKIVKKYKTSWNSSKFIDTYNHGYLYQCYNINIELDTNFISYQLWIARDF